jgi:NADPH:quinone reductase-like Zn-dependent oxidoreductase
MKAIVWTQYGPPETALQLREIDRPTPKANEVQVRIAAASVNALDWHLMRATPFLARFEAGLLKPKNPKLGADIAGTVEAVGSGVTRFKPGDAVFGDIWQSGLGGFAEYGCTREDLLVARPDNLSFEAAAAVPTAALTALQGLDKGQLQAGQSVLVNGASGGVGTFAVQIAKARCADVTAVCSTSKVELARSIGAGRVIDYTREDFTRSGQQYDLIFCAVGNHSVSDYLRALKPQGIAIVAGFTDLRHLFEHMLIAPRRSKPGGRQVVLMQTVKANPTDLERLRDLLATGKIVPVIDRTYPLERTPQAIGYVEQGHARGKVVITVGPG